jgi:hypothetical protein
MLELFQAKWNPVRIGKTRQVGNPEPSRFERSLRLAGNARRRGGGPEGDAAAGRGNPPGPGIIGKFE